jgi:UDP-N-acetylmuramoylalanine--D-glutamate ligase
MVLSEPVDWSSLRVVVCGKGITGTAAAAFLVGQGARVDVVEASPDEPAPDVGTPDLVIASPGWPPSHPLLAAMHAAGVPIWSEMELAWRHTPAGTRWLAVTGTNGKTTTTEMLQAMLVQHGLSAAAAGNIGMPLIKVVTAANPPDWLAVELSSFQLHFPHTLAPHAATILNVAPDHIDWHGSVAAYASDKGSVFGHGTIAVFNADDAWSIALASGAGERISFTTGEPERGEYGVAGGALVDGEGARICRVGDLRVVGEHNIANALAASALARTAGVPAQVAGEALRAFEAGAHRLAFVATIKGVRYVDDSKATNPHAASRALASHDRVVWIAGGLNKGVEYDGLVEEARGRFVAAVLIGSSAGELRTALSRHAPEVPVHDADSMQTAVEVAAGIARPGDTVLLAPAAASMDMFRDYRHRGDAFTAAVHALATRTET